MIKLVFFTMLFNPILALKNLQASNILESLYLEPLHIRSVNTSNVVESSAPVLDMINNTLLNITNNTLSLNNTNQTITIDERYVMPPPLWILIQLKIFLIILKKIKYTN